MCVWGWGCSVLPIDGPSITLTSCMAAAAVGNLLGTLWFGRAGIFSVADFHGLDNKAIITTTFGSLLAAASLKVNRLELFVHLARQRLLNPVLGAVAACGVLLTLPFFGENARLCNKSIRTCCPFPIPSL